MMRREEKFALAATPFVDPGHVPRVSLRVAVGHRLVVANTVHEPEVGCDLTVGKTIHNALLLTNANTQREYSRLWGRSQVYVQGG